jgi:hypothetical protein
LDNRLNSIILIVLLVIATSFVVVAEISNSINLAQAKKSHGHSTTSSTSKSKSSKPGAYVPGTTGGGYAVQPPPGTGPLTPPTANNSAVALAIAHRLDITSVNASKTQAKLGTPCLPQLNKFILPSKEARFTVIKSCVTVTGRVVWTNYFNNDGDANFNVELDPPYKNMLGPGSYSKVFASKYPGGPALHMETVCQGPVTSTSKENVGACDGYNGPNFTPVLPKMGQHVMVTGRYLIEMPEMPGGITELHPVYGIKILP